VTAGARAGERAVLPGVAKIEGEQTGLFDKDDVTQARISLSLTDLPAGLPASLLRQRFADWQQITVGSDAYQSLLNRLRRLLLDEQRALIDVSDRLRRARQQLSVQDEELRELEERAQQSSEMGEPMERASEGIEALMARVDQLQVEQYSQEEAVEKLRADLDHLQGVP
jgi:DNA repair ATPase RecN